MAAPRKSRLPQNLATPLWGRARVDGKRRLKETFCTLAPSSTTRSSQKAEVPQVSVRGCVHKQNVVYPHDGMLCSLEEDENSDTHHDMGEPSGHCAT